MSIVCGAIKRRKVAIASDTQSKFGTLKVNAPQLKNASKLIEVRRSIIGVVGWGAMISVVEHLANTRKALFRLSDRHEIFETLLRLHPILKKQYFLEPKENEDQPVESNQITAIIINRNGLFETGSYKEVNEYRSFWAIGAGQELALGAMHALYATSANAREIVEAGVRAAAQFDDSCALPLDSKVIKLAS